MYKYDKSYLGNKAQELGFNRDTLEKVTRLYNILRFFNTMPIIKNNLALKGGTAINFTMLNLPRLSVDIDLDYTNNIQKEDMLIERDNISNAINKYMISEGYVLNNKSKHHYSLDSFIFQYQGVSGNLDQIKIEINYSLRAHIDQREFVKALHPIFSNDFMIHRLSIIEIFASKITALLTRVAARDLFDVYQMISHGLIKDKELNHLRKSIIFYHLITTSHSKLFNIEVIDSINQRMIKRDLKPVLSKDDPFNFKEAVIEVKNFLAHLLQFTPNEVKFIDLFLRNEYEPSLLFDDPNIIEEIKKHPMILWKLMNTN